MDRQPLLQGDKVLLRPLVREDWQALYSVASDPEIWAMHPYHDRHEEAVFRVFFDQALASGGALAIVEKASGKIIGSSRYSDQKPESSEIEIGWTFFAVRCWRMGYNREVKRLMLQHIYRFVDSVVFQVGAENWRSRKAVERLGGVLRSQEMREYNGRKIPHVTYVLDKAAARCGALALEETKSG